MKKLLFLNLLIMGSVSANELNPVDELTKWLETCSDTTIAELEKTLNEVEPLSKIQEINKETNSNEFNDFIDEFNDTSNAFYGFEESLDLSLATPFLQPVSTKKADRETYNTQDNQWANIFEPLPSNEEIRRSQSALPLMGEIYDQRLNSSLSSQRSFSVQKEPSEPDIKPAPKKRNRSKAIISSNEKDNDSGDSDWELEQSKFTHTTQQTSKSAVKIAVIAKKDMTKAKSCFDKKYTANKDIREEEEVISNSQHVKIKTGDVLSPPFQALETSLTIQNALISEKVSDVIRFLMEDVKPNFISHLTSQEKFVTCACKKPLSKGPGRTAAIKVHYLLKPDSDYKNKICRKTLPLYQDMEDAISKGKMTREECCVLIKKLENSLITEYTFYKNT